MNQRQLALGSSYEKILFLEAQYALSNESTASFFLEELVIEHTNVFESYNKKIKAHCYKTHTDRAEDQIRKHSMDVSSFIINNYKDILKLMKKNNCNSIDHLLVLFANKKHAVIDLFQLNIKNVIYIQNKFSA